MKISIFTILILFLGSSVHAQKLISKTGVVSFHSHTPVEDIDAVNNQVVSILDPNEGSIQINLLVRSFNFKKELMQEHFNENYMESDQFPKSAFKGAIQNNATIDYSKDGTTTIKVKGELTIHGVTNPITVNATLVRKGGKLTAQSKFVVHPADYSIEIPDLVKDKIASEIEVAVEIPYD